MLILLTSLVVLFLSSAAYFAAVETAVLASSRIRIRKAVEKGEKRAEAVLGFLDEPERFLTAILLGNNVSVIAGTTIATALADKYLGPIEAALVSSLGMTILVVMFAEVMPKSVTLHNPEYYSAALSRSINAFIVGITPVAWLFSKFAYFLLKMMGVKSSGRLPFVSREELRRILTESRASTRTVALEKKMITRIFSFGETVVSRVMVPLIEVKSLPKDATASHLVEYVKKYGFSRFPVYEGRVDNVVGIVAAKDFIGQPVDTPIKEYIRRCDFVPETKSIESLLPLLEEDDLKLAVVVDEYGGVVGLVTLEDLIEEIVGEIEDEYDRREEEIIFFGEAVELNSSVSVNSFNEKMPTPIPKGDYETLGGFIIAMMGRIPRRGEEYKLPPYVFIVLEASDRAVNRLRVIVESEAGESNEGVEG
ncbi:MAG: HlyC/CorC family transporter [bacterium]|nr:HlyC/CorC family transporter [bacterium]